MYEIIDISSDHRYSGGDIMLPSLSISDIAPTDETYYRVSVTNNDGTTTKEVYIDVVLSSPSISLNSRYSVLSGENLTLETNITSVLPITNVTWERRNSSTYVYEIIDILSDNRYTGGEILSPSLTIIHVDLTDETYYRVRATNDEGTTTTTVYLDVLPRLPNISEGTTSVLTWKGVNITFHLNVTSYLPITEISWEYTMNNSTSYYEPLNITSVLKYSGGTISSPPLTIYNVTSADNGLYRCAISNRDGTTLSSVFQIRIETCLPVISVGSTSILVKTRSNAILQLNYTSGPEIKFVTWERRSSNYPYTFSAINITANDRYNGGTIDKPYLEIVYAALEDSGYYRCTVVNTDGMSTSPLFNVNVQTQLVTINVSATSYTVNQGDNVTLSVILSDTEINSTIVWEKQGINDTSYTVIDISSDERYEGGSMASPSLSIFNITNVDFGYYRCKVTNIDGTSTSPWIQVTLGSSYMYEESGCDKLSCGGLKECVYRNNKPTCSVVMWKAAAAGVAGAVGAVATVGVGVAAVKSLTAAKSVSPLNVDSAGNTQASKSEAENLKTEKEEMKQNERNHKNQRKSKQIKRKQ
ncbi:V-set and immunoglobulin domain-containing protein 10-like [Saccostrea cucullata]|uniref:V-set and immunoglobulin domain-containing protein 10-like n=1 Tax=Saccostrea cuccullata TaxID=36930 RepID=UPI002ED5E154